MWMNEYQRKALRTANPHLTGIQAKCYAALKLAGEAGEVADLVGKYLGQGHKLDDNEITKELGDVFWNLAYAAHVFGFDLSTIAQVNLDKLQARYPDGFDVNRSINREVE